MELADFAGAKADLRDASAADPTSKEVHAAFAACKEREARVRKAGDDAQREVFARMF